MKMLCLILHDLSVPPNIGNTMTTPRYFLLRYDTEHPKSDEMEGFLSKVLSVHHQEEIPVTLFCTGKTLDERREEFKEFWVEAKESQYIDVQDHSYSHVGVGYENGLPVDELRANHERSFKVHEEVFGKWPIGVALCGVGDSGPRLSGLDSTDKSKAELAFMADLGVKMLPAYVTYRRPGCFCSYKRLGYPDIMGFPSAESDTSWLRGHTLEEALNHCYKVIDNSWDAGNHGAIIMHDWCQWNHGPDKELTLTKKIAAYARKKGFTLATMAQCYENKELWYE